MVDSLLDLGDKMPTNYYAPDFLAMPAFTGFYSAYMQTRSAENMKLMQNFLEQVDPTYYREQLKDIRENIKEYRMMKMEMIEASRKGQTQFVADLLIANMQETGDNQRLSKKHSADWQNRKLTIQGNLLEASMKGSGSQANQARMAGRIVLAYKSGDSDLSLLLCHMNKR